MASQVAAANAAHRSAAHDSAAHDSPAHASTAHASAQERSGAVAAYTSWLIRVTLLVIVYWSAARLGLSMAQMAEQVSPVWPPTGIALAALVLMGYRVWPGIAVGAFLANAMANEPIGTAVAIAAGNTLEALLGAWLLQCLVGFDPSLERLRDAFGLIILAAGVSTMVSATIGVTSLCLSGIQSWSVFGSLWWVWWLGDAMGDLVVAPLLLTWAPRTPTAAALPARTGRWPWYRIVEAGVLLTGLIVSSLIVFGGPSITSEDFSLKLRIFPFAIWAVLRFGQRGMAITCLVITGLAIWGTLHGTGPFSVGPIEQRLLVLQAFMMVVPITGLLVGSALSERKRAQEALQDGHNLLRAVIDGIPEAIYVKDCQGRYLLLNSAGAHLIKKSVEDVLGRDDTVLFVPETAQRIMESDRRALESGAIQSYEHCAAAVTGVTHTFHTVKGPLRGPDGSIQGILGISRDITEVKRAEEALAEKEHLYRSAIEAAGAVPYVRNYVLQRFDYVGPGIQALLGFTPEEFTLAVWNRQVQEIYPFGKPTLLSVAEASRWLRSLEGPGWWADVRVHNVRGEERWLNNAAVKVMDERGTVVESLGLWQDITERKQAERRMQEYAVRLQALSHRVVKVQEEERRHLARELHDEIGQVFTAIGINLHHLKAICEPAAVARLDESIAVVDRAIHQVRNLALDLRPATLDVLGLEPALRWFLEQQRQRTGLDIQLVGYLEKRLPPDLEMPCFRVVQEALSNAVRHARAQHVSVELQHDDAELQLIIRDDGCGFDVAAALEKVAAGDSFGVLGMQERIELAGGTMDIISHPGKGTHIHARLPLPAAGDGGGGRERLRDGNDTYTAGRRS